MLRHSSPDHFKITWMPCSKKIIYLRLTSHQNLVSNELRNLLDKAQNNVIASQSTNPQTEENNVNANEMDMEFHNKRAQEEKSPEASRKGERNRKRK